jgi:hypothetical protein
MSFRIRQPTPSVGSAPNPSTGPGPQAPVGGSPPAPPGSGRPWLNSGALPDDLLDGAFSRLDPGLPLLLLPLRVETHYNLDVAPPELRIRIYPEQFHVDPAVSSPSKPAHPVLLPRRWLAVGYAADGEQLFSQASTPIPPGLRTGPDAAAPTIEISGGDLAVEEGLAWMVDYEEAIKVGMALTISLDSPAVRALQGVDVLLVLGVQEQLDPLAGAAELSRLLSAHAGTSGLAFVPQGTPTNNTASVTSGWSAGDQPASPSGPPPDAGDDNAAELSSAFGFADSSALLLIDNAADREAQEAQDMRTVLFEAVLGTLVRQLLNVGNQQALSSGAIDALRDWFISNVAGGGPLPALRIGSQPYGVLPVRRSVNAPDLATPAGQVESVVALMSDVWRQSSEGLPSLDPDQAGDDFDAALGSILAAQPHPARIFLRKLEEFVEGSTALAIQYTYSFLISTLASAVDTNHYVQGISEAALIYYWLLPTEYPNGFQSIDDQLAFCALVEDTLRGRGLSQDILDPGLTFMDSLREVLNGYEGRQRPLRWLSLDRFEGVLGELNTTLVGGKLYGEMAEWGATGLVQAPDAEPGSTAADYLADLRQRFKNRASDGTLAPSSLSLSPRPLLCQLLEFSLPLAPNKPASNKPLLAALDNLAALSPERLEWLLRETLGLGAHRLDAWATSLASERLARLRQARPNGLQIGAFCWVTQLKPNRSRRLSTGFIHAPSLAHATTAALLRSGWQAHGSQDPASPVAVDISSTRVRSAAWLLDGIRQGQPLGETLGYRFERSLHDLGVSDQIQPLRQLVLAAQGSPRAGPDQPVDGIDLLELSRSGGLGAVSTVVKTALSDLEAIFDAVQDVGLFEAVHQLAAGNYERATAMLDSVSTGSIAPPELRAPLTPRSAISVEQRVIILLHPQESSAGSGWVPGIRDGIAPALEGWFAALLPPARDVGFQVSEVAPAGETGSTISLTLADLQLSALDAVYLAGDDTAAVPPGLRTLAAAAAGTAGAVTVDPLSSNTAFSLADFILLASELRRLAESLRPLDAPDLRPASSPGEGDADPSTALAAIEALIVSFDRLGDDLDEAIQDGRASDMAAAVARLARFGISSGASPQDPAAASALLDVYNRRLNNVIAQSVDSADPQPGLEARLATAIGRRLPVLGLFVIQGADGGAVVDVGDGLADPLDVDEWFDGVSRARAELGRLASVGLLSELMGGAGLSLYAGQDPLRAGEGWAATHRPAGPGRLAILAASAPGGPPRSGETACGLFVDQWSEPVPSDHQTTGLAFQYDAPSNRPPQAWLLAVTPDGQPWSLKLVADTLLQTLDRSQLRAVCAEDLLDYGRSIPTSFVSGDILNWPKESNG